MKKRILVLMIGFLLIGVNLYAAGDLIVEGNVGIGTTNPGGGAAVVKLDVRGNITATQDTDTASAIYLSRSGGPTSGWNSPGGTWGVYRYGSGEGDRFSIGIPGVNEPFRIHTDGNVIMGVTSSGASSGNVGIGTPSPGRKLSVVGDIGLSGALRLGLNSYADGGGSIILEAPNGDDFAVTQWDGSAWTRHLYVDAVTGNVGIGTTAPNTKADIDGDIALRVGTFTAINGSNNNINIRGKSFIRITVPTAAFSITGIAGGVDGKVVILYNATTYSMTIANESTSSTDINRITTLSGSGISTTGVGAITLIYDSTASRWIVTSARL